MSGIRVTYSGLISLAVALLSTITGLAFSLIMTRMLNPQEFGIWNLITGLLFYGTMLDSIISSWTTRETARGIESGRTAILSSGIFSIPGIFIYVIIAYFAGQQSQVDQNILFFAIILIPARYLYKILTSINAGWKPQAISYAGFSSEIIKIPTGLFFLYFLNMGVSGVIIAYVISYIVSNIIQIIYARDKIKNKIKKEFLNNWLRLSWVPLYPRAASLLYRSDGIIFSVITGSVVGLSYYSAALIIGSIAAYAGAISSSSYAKLLEGGGKKNYLQENLIQLFYFLIPFAALSITFARPSLFVLNPLYEIAYPVVIFITIRILFSTLGDTFYSYLTGIEKVDINKESSFKDYLKSKLFFLPTLQMIQYSVYVCALIILIIAGQTLPQLDLVIYWSILALITQIPYTLYLYVLIKKNFTLSLDFNSIFKYTLVSLGVFGLMYQLSERFLIYKNNIFEFLPNLLLFLIIGLASYCTITYFIDIRTKKLFKSIIYEIRNKMP